MNYDAMTNAQRAALQRRTARAVRYLGHFHNLPVQVGSPCPTCGGLFWWVTGRQEFAPSGYCLNCKPDHLANQPKLRKIVAEAMVDGVSEASYEDNNDGEQWLDVP